MKHKNISTKKTLDYFLENYREQHIDYLLFEGDITKSEYLGFDKNPTKDIYSNAIDCLKDNLQETAKEEVIDLIENFLIHTLKQTKE